MEAFGLYQCLHQPTRVTSTCSSLIDHVYANHPNLVSALSVGSPLSTSNHLSVCLHLSVISKLPKSPMCELWFYNKADFESIAEILDSLLAGLPNPSTSGVDKAWSNFKSTFLRIITEMVPHKLVKTRKSLPWLTKAARHYMQMRDRAHREAKKFNTASLWEKFRSLRNQTINILRQEKREESFFPVPVITSDHLQSLLESSSHAIPGPSSCSIMCYDWFRLSYKSIRSSRPIQPSLFFLFLF